MLFLYKYTAKNQIYHALVVGSVKKIASKMNYCPYWLAEAALK